MNSQAYHQFAADTLKSATPEEDRSQHQLEAERKALEEETLAKLALRNFGIAADASDAAYTAHPVMAGVCRNALSQAYQAGMSEIAGLILKSAMRGNLPSQRKDHQS